MAVIGKSILNSTLMSKAQTRQWMKPISFASNLNQGVGAPWEIFRTQIGGRTVDLYTKNGGFGSYGTLLILVPDYDIGLTFLSASPLNSDIISGLMYLIAEMLTEAILPVLEDVTKDQAKVMFAGQYAASDLNSSLTVTIDDQPGLRVSSWVTNGTDVFDDVGLSSDGGYIDFRLQPNQLYTEGKVGFTGVRQRMPQPIYTGPLDLNCFTWGATGITYGNIDIENFVFNIDPKTAKATSVQPMALRINLERNQ